MNDSQEPQGPPPHILIRLDRVEQEQKATKTRLNEGAKTFGRMRAAVWAAVIAGASGAAGWIYELGARADRMETSAASFVELKSRVQEQTKEMATELKGITVDLGAVKILLQEERARREQVERDLREALRRRR